MKDAGYEFEYAEIEGNRDEKDPEGKVCASAISRGVIGLMVHFALVTYLDLSLTIRRPHIDLYVSELFISVVHMPY